MSASYSRPPPFTWLSVTPRKLLPTYPPPEPLPRPALPSPPRKAAFTAPYTLSTHIFPAAYLRSTEFLPAPLPSPANCPREARQAQAELTRQELKDLRGSLEPRGSPQLLWNCANRYVRQGLDENEAKGITLFFAHANGFPKEIWEPVLHHLLSSPAASVIDEIWTWESVQHGDACLINGDKNGGIFDWTDNTRDILNFLNFYLPTVPSASLLPTHLPRLPLGESEYRKDNPFRRRTLIAIGHSYGGCTCTLAALTQPKLFSSLILIDPVIIKPDGNLIHASKHVDQLIMGSLLRRETWASREEALKLLSQSPFFAAWDPAVLKVYVECGTYNTVDPATGTPIVKLKMPGMQEAVVFSETHTELEVYEQLPKIDERINLRWVMPGKLSSGFGPPSSTRERVWLRPANASNIRIPNASHLIPQEQPQLLARDLQEFIQRHIAPRANL